MTFDIVNFQTPPVVCNFMASLVDPTAKIILEPTPGAGHLVSALHVKTGATIATPQRDFWNMQHKVKYDYVVMNPPFTPMVQALTYVQACMSLSDNIIALIPWFIITNSVQRTQKLIEFGFESVTHLPRKTFPNSRIQCCVIKLKKGYTAKTTFDIFTF